MPFEYQSLEKLIPVAMAAVFLGTAADGNGDGDGDGDGNGDGDGDGYGYGNGNGYGYGYGNGNGDGDGYGDGDGNGDGNGDGDGDGDGYGDGDGNGDGYGDGDGNGYGDGYGDGDGNGYGDGNGNGEPAIEVDLGSLKGRAMKYMIVRTQNAGVFAGYLVGEPGDTVKLKDARRLWYWSGAASLSQLAVQGVSKPKDCKFPVAVPGVQLFGVIEILETTEAARKSIAAVPIWSA